ncbi:MAG: MBL fold metallo-hydrolase [Desulfoarculaceae bacterium]|nr:MBL fold metallo-hydrolase [Desulfoarculaceae bacterium]
MTRIPLSIGACEIHWLSGGDFRLDGGAMFGPVPKALWQKCYQPDADNTIPLCNDPLLIITPAMNILVDTGLGNKLTPKEQAIFQAGPWNLLSQLALLGISRYDIDLVILTHGDFDHVGGVVMVGEEGREEVTFPEATHLIQEREWPDVVSPGRRAQESYWPINFKELQRSGQVQLVEGTHQVCPEVRVRHTGGHTQGHQLIEISSQGETTVHLGDLFPTHAHSNPLWVMAYDNFPLEVIACKERYFAEYRQRDAWFTFYHDPLVRACRLGEKGEIIDQWPYRDQAVVPSAG